MNSPALLLIAAIAIIMLTAGLVILVRGGGADQKRLKRRMAGLSAPHSMTVQARGPSLSKAEPGMSTGQKLLRKLWWLVGYNKEVPKMPVPPWLVSVIAVIIARGITWMVTSVAGDYGWVAFPLAALVLMRSYFVWCTNRWRTALFKQFPDALSTIVRAVRVGVSLPEGIRQVAQEAPQPTAAIFAEIADALAIGTPLTDAMGLATAKTGVPEYRFFTTALVLQSRTGGGLAATLEGLADVIRKRVMVKARGKALASEARASGIVLAVLPLLTIAGMMMFNPDYMMTLFVTDTGHKIIAAAILFEGVGIFTMRTMIAKSLA
jgi:tight adherence protein B